MYERAFIERYQQKLRNSREFAEDEDLQASVSQLCASAVFIAADPQTAEGRTAILKEFGGNCRTFFVKRMLQDDWDGDAIDDYVRRLKELDQERHILTEMLRYHTALSAFLDNMHEESFPDVPDPTPGNSPS